MDGQDFADRQRTRHQKRLGQLEAERLKLLQAHYADAIPLDLLKAEQQRITDEVEATRAALHGTTARLDELMATVDEAVTFAQHCYQAYVKGSQKTRRLLNQAFFEKVWVTEEGVTGWTYTQPFAVLMARHGAPGPHVVVEYEATAQTEADEAFEADTDQPLF